MIISRKRLEEIVAGRLQEQEQRRERICEGGTTR